MTSIDLKNLPFDDLLTLRQDVKSELTYADENSDFTNQDNFFDKIGLGDVLTKSLKGFLDDIESEIFKRPESLLVKKIISIEKVRLEDGCGVCVKFELMNEDIYSITFIRDGVTFKPLSIFPLPKKHSSSDDYWKIIAQNVAIHPQARLRMALKG